MNTEIGVTGYAIRRGPIMLIMIMGAFLATLNQTIMSVALPELMKDFTIVASTAQWLTTGYMLVNGILIPITAYLMNRFTTRQLFQTSMLLFLIGTVLSSLAGSFPVLLTGRLVQAAGAGITMPLLMQVVLALYPPEKRGAAMGMVGLAVIFAPALGPVLAGYILEHFSWKALFLGILPLTVVVIISGFLFLKNVSEERTNPKIDMISVLLSTAGFGTLLYGFSRAGIIGWSSSEVIFTLGAGVVSLVLFSWRQFASDSPLLDLRAFHYPMFSLTSVINMAVTIVMYADMILLPLYLQNARGYTAMESGMLMLPGSILMGILMPVTGKLFDRFGAKWLAVIGFLIMIATTFSFTHLSASTSFLILTLMATGRRIGMAMILMPVQTAGLNQLPAKLNADGTAISNTLKQVAGAVGTSLLVTVMTNRTTAHMRAMTSGNGAGNPAGQLLNASIQGINDAYLVILAISILSLLLSLFIKNGRQGAKEIFGPSAEIQPEEASSLTI